jgi:hypothetical protein
MGQAGLAADGYMTGEQQAGSDESQYLSDY